MYAGGRVRGFLRIYMLVFGFMFLLSIIYIPAEAFFLYVFLVRD